MNGELSWNNYRGSFLNIVEELDHFLLVGYWERMDCICNVEILAFVRTKLVTNLFEDSRGFYYVTFPF